MDATKSPMGARLLKRWLIFPLQNVTQINNRLDAVETLLNEPAASAVIIELIESCGDLERLSSKLSTRKLQPREFMQLAKSLEAIEQIKQALSPIDNDYLQHINKELDICANSKKIILAILNIFGSIIFSKYSLRLPII